ncbi:MAG: fumarylacetoacetate hydrolase family protein [Proteobacteria bacterium]|nr:fumarylacetoacetate hydrolase family protein [Pseudomonadota bacterium]
MEISLEARTTLPTDAETATLVGRIWRPDVNGPSIVTLRDGKLFDITAAAPTMTDLINADDPATYARHAIGDDLGPVGPVIANSAVDARDPSRPWLLAPVDLSALKAAGVTFVGSMLERVIEERAAGDPAAAEEIRRVIMDAIGDNLAAVVPGSPEAADLKKALQDRDMWSQYLEVGIGPDAEVFTKSQPMSAVGTGAEVGIHPGSSWNNPEPEIVLILGASGKIIGATLGNDVNLRDFEGRSALLLGKAKDNNASCSVGPFIRLIDESFGLNDIRNALLSMRVTGDDQFVLDGESSMQRISRDIGDLAGQTLGAYHQYPDGAALFTGTAFAPTKDRGAKGEGFTHKVGDIVTISSPKLGALTNRVTTCEKAAPWVFGASALMRNLAGRGVL